MEPGPDILLSRRLFLTLAALILAVHVGLVLVACPPSVVFGDRPFGVADYNTHYQQTVTVGRALERFGKTWAYDPNLLAGVPAGLFFDVDNKAHALFTFGLVRIGVRQPVAFNLFTLVSCLLAPLSLLWAARLLRLGRGGQLWAMGLTVALWHFDSGLRYFWSSGMISFATVSHGAMPVLALFYRLLGARRSTWHGLGFALALCGLLPLLLLIHVWSFVICVAPMVTLYAVHLRRLPLVRHLQIWAVALVAVLANAFWLFPALAHLDLLAPATVLGQANPMYLVADFLGVVRLPYQTDFILLHTFFRFLALVAALITLWWWRRQSDQRFLLGVVGLGWLAGVSYLGGWVPVLKATEPYRFIAPMMLMSALLAGPWITTYLAQRPWRQMSAATRIALVALLLLLAPRALREMLCFLPEASPPAYIGAGDPSQIGIPDFKAAPPTRPFRIAPVSDEIMVLASFVQRSCREEGRVLVREWPVAEVLRWATDRAIVGGFNERRTIHEEANVFRRLDEPRLHGEQLAAYVRRYAIHYLVLTGAPDQRLEMRFDLFRLKRVVAGFRIYEVPRPTPLVDHGAGQVTAGLNRIDVREARGVAQRLVLRFHHMRTLGCRPGCRIEREPIPGDPAGFIRVVGQPMLPRKFVVEHQYR